MTTDIRAGLDPSGFDSTSIRRHEVSMMYESALADRYDVSARIWERLVCSEALIAFDHRLKRLPPRPLRVLDLGCGTGRNLRRLHLADVAIDSYTGVDASQRMLSRARANFPYSIARFEHSDVDDRLDRLNSDRYDLILATWLLSHHPNPSMLIERCRERLSDGGRLLVLAITASRRLRGQLHGWRFRNFLQSHPVDIDVIHDAEPRLVGITANGLVTIAEFDFQPPR